MARAVSDEVWQQLDPKAGRLSRRTTMRLRWAVLAAIVLAVVTGLVWQSGAVTPHLARDEHAGGSWSSDFITWRIEFLLTVHNYGWFSATVVGAGQPGPGLELLEVRGAFPTTLNPGENMEIALVYRVADCDAVPRDAWPVPIFVERPWGRYTAYVPPPYLTWGAPDGMRTYVGRDPYAREWQDVLADVACHPRPQD